MTRNPAWSDAENAALAAAYVEMARKSAEGISFNKSAIRRALMANELAARSNGSIEAKLMNFSAAAQDLGLPVVPGYKPAPNYQASIRVALMQAWEASPKVIAPPAPQRVHIPYFPKF